MHPEYALETARMRAGRQNHLPAGAPDCSLNLLSESGGCGRR